MKPRVVKPKERRRKRRPRCRRCPVVCTRLVVHGLQLDGRCALLAVEPRKEQHQAAQRAV